MTWHLICGISIISLVEFGRLLNVGNSTTEMFTYNCYIPIYISILVLVPLFISRWKNKISSLNHISFDHHSLPVTVFIYTSILHICIYLNKHTYTYLLSCFIRGAVYKVLYTYIFTHMLHHTPYVYAYFYSTRVCACVRTTHTPCHKSLQYIIQHILTHVIWYTLRTYLYRVYYTRARMYPNIINYPFSEAFMRMLPPTPRLHQHTQPPRHEPITVIAQLLEWFIAVLCIRVNRT